MATWLPNNKDDTLAPTCYVPGLPRVSKTSEPGPLTGVTDNPSDFPDSSSLGNVSDSPKYMHYCTRLLRWSDISLDPFSVSGTPLVHKTKRFGDLGGYYMRYNNGSPVPETSGASSNLNSVFTRYRFPAEIVPYNYYGARGAACPVGVFPFKDRTCAWLPGAEDSSFFWTPTTSDWTAIESGFSTYLTAKGTSLTALAALDQIWNLAIVAWMWAGYQRQNNTPGSEEPYKGASNRLVSDCDVFYLPFLY